MIPPIICYEWRRARANRVAKPSKTPLELLSPCFVMPYLFGVLIVKDEKSAVCPSSLRFVFRAWDSPTGTDHVGLLFTLKQPPTFLCTRQQTRYHDDDTFSLVAERGPRVVTARTKLASSLHSPFCVSLGAFLPNPCLLSHGGDDKCCMNLISINTYRVLSIVSDCDENMSSYFSSVMLG